MNIAELISKMSLEEKASLLSGLDFWHTKPVERLGIPSTMVSDGPHGLRKQDQSGDHLGINDSIKAVCFPPACAGAASFDRGMMTTMGEAIGKACQHENLSVILGPAVNIKRSPLCGRNFEYLSEDPFLAGEMAAAMIEGVQSQHVGTSVKHFAANNQEFRRMSSDSVVDERTLREIYLPAFEAAVKKGKAWTVMCSYNRLNGEYASQNKWLLHDVLREEWGFDGYVMSDWGAVSDRVKGVSAGLDLEMPASGGSNDARIVKAVNDGQLSMEDVDAAVTHILTVIDRYISNRKPETEWDKEAQHDLARSMEEQCIVLLKNEDNLLPLKAEERVLFVGKFAKEPRFQGGGSSHINCIRTESALDAVNGTVDYAMGYETKDDQSHPELIAEAVQKAQKADKVVVFAGLPDSFESEGYDRTHMRLPDCQNALIDALLAVNPNVIVVLHNGSPVEMPWVHRVKGILEAYLGGEAVGGAVANVLFGKANPSGRLPETFPVRLEDTPTSITYGRSGNSVPYSEGIFVGYRYYDRKDLAPLFPFGYGLSYTTFAYSNLKTDKETMTANDDIHVSVDVTNTGACPGKEVVQLYVRNPENSNVLRPIRELRGFEKIELLPGETKTVQFTLNIRAFSYWNITCHDWYPENGTYHIEISKNSREPLLETPVVLTGTPVVFEPVTPDTLFMDLKKNPKAMQAFSSLMEKMMKIFSPDESKSTAASEAVTAEMEAAMFENMPLRGLVSFGNGAISYDEIAALCDQLNQK